MSVIELGLTRYGGPVEWEEHDSLRNLLHSAQYIVDWNLAYPYQIRVDGVIRWERLPDEHLNFRWRRVAKAEVQ